MTTSNDHESREYESMIFSAELGAPVPEIDLHSMTVLEATKELELFLDQQFMARERVVRIIHGRGTGALKDAVQQWLGVHVLVDFYRQALNPNEQGAVTYAVLAHKTL